MKTSAKLTKVLVEAGAALDVKNKVSNPNCDFPRACLVH